MATPPSAISVSEISEELIRSQDDGLINRAYEIAWLEKDIASAIAYLVDDWTPLSPSELREIETCYQDVAHTDSPYRDIRIKLVQALERGVSSGLPNENIDFRADQLPTPEWDLRIIKKYQSEALFAKKKEIVITKCSAWEIITISDKEVFLPEYMMVATFSKPFPHNGWKLEGDDIVKIDTLDKNFTPTSPLCRDENHTFIIFGTDVSDCPTLVKYTPNNFHDAKCFKVVATQTPISSLGDWVDSTVTDSAAEKTKQPIFGDIHGNPYCFDPAKNIFYCITSNNEAVIWDKVTKLPTFLEHNGNIFICVSGRPPIRHTTESIWEKSADTPPSKWQSKTLIEGDESTNAVTYFYNPDTKGHVIGNMTPSRTLDCNKSVITNYKPTGEPYFKMDSKSSGREDCAIPVSFASDEKDTLIYVAWGKNTVEEPWVSTKLTLVGLPEELMDTGITQDGKKYYIFFKNNELIFYCSDGTRIIANSGNVRTKNNVKFLAYQKGDENFVHIIGEWKTVKLGRNSTFDEEWVNLKDESTVSILWSSWKNFPSHPQRLKYPAGVKGAMQHKMSQLGALFGLSKKGETIHITHEEIIAFLRGL